MSPTFHTEDAKDGWKLKFIHRTSLSYPGPCLFLPAAHLQIIIKISPGCPPKWFDWQQTAEPLCHQHYFHLEAGLEPLLKAYRQ